MGNAGLGHMHRGAFKADGLLLLAAAIWGTGFVAQRLGMDHVGPMTFNGIRFAIGVFVLIPVIYMRRPMGDIPGSDGCVSHASVYVFGGGLAGLVVFVAAGLQQIGLVYTTAGKAGFITGLYVVFVPIMGLFIRRRVGAPTWLGAGLAMVGLYFLSVTGSLHVNRGDWFVLTCALFWALHVLIIGSLAPRTDPVKLAAVQFAVASVLSGIAAALTEEITGDGIVGARWAILYSGALSVAVAFTLQVVAQRDAPPAHAAILLSLEAVFAAGTGWLLLSETLGVRGILGCTLMLAGSLASQVRRPSHTIPVP